MIRRGGGGPPRKLGDSLDRALRDLAGGTTRGATQPLAGARDVFSRWDELVGPEVAAHARPLRLRDDKLVLLVDDATWGAELRWLEADLCRRILEAGGPRLAGIEVRVRP